MTRLLAPLLAIALVAAPASVEASLGPVARARLLAGESVRDPVVHVRDGHRFVGGVVYQIVDADPERVSAVLRDPTRYRAIFPRLESATLERIDPSGRAHVRFHHALGPFSGSYGVAMEFSQKGRLCRFWVDRRADDALQDGWGFLRLTPLPRGKTLVTYAVLFDLGDGIVRSLFEERIQRAALDLPRRLAHAATS